MTMDELSQMESTLAAANALEHPLEGLESLLDVNVKNDNQNSNVDDSTQLSRTRYQQSPLSQELQKQCLALFEKNMGDMCLKSDWGLGVKEKQEELQHESARFLLFHDNNNDNKL